MNTQGSPLERLSATLHRFVPLTVIGTLGALLAATAFSFLTPALAVAKAPIIIGADPDIAISGSSAPSERLREADRFLRSEIAVLSSKELLERAKNAAGEKGLFRAASIQRFGTDIVDLSVSGKDPKGAGKVLRSLLDIYAGERIENYSRQTAVSIARLDARAKQLRELADDSVTGAGDWEAFTSELDALSQTRASLGMRSVQREDLVRVVDKTDIAGSPVSRFRSNFLLLGALTGLIGGLSLAMARDRLRNDVVTGSSELTEFAGLPVLGTFSGTGPAVGADIATEAARIANLLSALDVQRVMISGAANGQAASTVAERVASASAATNRPTVLFDASGQGNRRRDFDLVDLASETERGIDTLGALFRAAIGRHQPLVIANGTHLDQTDLPRPARAFFERIARDHGLVIIDSEPLASRGPSLRWARDSDVVVVVDPARTNRSELESALATLRLVTSRVVGIIVVHGAEGLPSNVRRGPVGVEAVPALRKIQI